MPYVEADSTLGLTSEAAVISIVETRGRRGLPHSEVRDDMGKHSHAKESPAPLEKQHRCATSVTPWLLVLGFGGDILETVSKVAEAVNAVAYFLTGLI